ncbi:hypothetical protein C7974DRAFT_376653 [Boeremia exigua]|uniref:uncharacterized protein n=1 Tax=Boeremia exigua TaxID=749465 RepID=UPI001E8D40D2|nr:uncharacterized protein C7974DRAFT_376653 [Boeremia exigua]KAH6629868.1 hypothetical protein C7974DRAFT_376653 [Boeremia exigua]
MNAIVITVKRRQPGGNHKVWAALAVHVTVPNACKATVMCTWGMALLQIERARCCFHVVPSLLIALKTTFSLTLFPSHFTIATYVPSSPHCYSYQRSQSTGTKMPFTDNSSHSPSPNVSLRQSVRLQVLLRRAKAHQRAIDDKILELDPSSSHREVARWMGEHERFLHKTKLRMEICLNQLEVHVRVHPDTNIKADCEMLRMQYQFFNRILGPLQPDNGICLHPTEGV